MSVIPSVVIPASELHQLLDIADTCPIFLHDDPRAAEALATHWRRVANEVLPNTLEPTEIPA